MFNIYDKRNKKIFTRVIVVILVLAMVVPILASLI